MTEHAHAVAKMPISAIPAAVWIAFAGILIAWGVNTATLAQLSSTMTEIKAQMATHGDLSAMDGRVTRLERHDESGVQTDREMNGELTSIHAELKGLRNDLERTERIAERHTSPGPQFERQ